MRAVLHDVAYLFGHVSGLIAVDADVAETIADPTFKFRFVKMQTTIFI